MTYKHILWKQVKERKDTFIGENFMVMGCFSSSTLEQEKSSWRIEQSIPQP